MPNDAWHKHWGFAGLAALVSVALVLNQQPKLNILVLSLGFLFGLFMLNPDVDTNSVSRNAWGPLKFIWRNRVYHFSHRGVMHSVILWVFLPVFGWALAMQTKELSCVYFTLGVSINAELHIVCDRIMDLMHASKLPVLKNI